MPRTCPSRLSWWFPHTYSQNILIRHSDWQKHWFSLCLSSLLLFSLMSLVKSPLLNLHFELQIIIESSWNSLTDQKSSVGLEFHNGIPEWPPHWHCGRRAVGNTEVVSYLKYLCGNREKLRGRKKKIALINHQRSKNSPFSDELPIIFLSIIHLISSRFLLQQVWQDWEMISKSCDPARFRDLLKAKCGVLGKETHCGWNSPFLQNPQTELSSSAYAH